MSMKYFCDICKNELSLYKRIHVGGFTPMKINTLCIECWNKAEKSLLPKIDSVDNKV